MITESVKPPCAFAAYSARSPHTFSNLDRLAADHLTGLAGQARDGLLAGLTAQVTGRAGFAADVASVFDGTDVSLLLVTVLVVAALLLVTYRSPLLWLVPLAVVGAGEQFAAAAVGAASRLFGYGTAEPNYVWVRDTVLLARYAA